MLAQLEWEQNGKVCCLSVARGPILIGRSGQLGRESRQLADRHCQIRHDGNVYLVENLDGPWTRVNGHPITAHRLQHGDLIQCADFSVRFLHVQKRGRRPVATMSSPSASGHDGLPAGSGTLPPELGSARVGAQHEPAKTKGPEHALRARIATLEQELDIKTNELTSLLESHEADIIEARRLRSELEVRIEDLRRATSERDYLHRELEESRERLAVAVKKLESEDEEKIALRGSLSDVDAKLRHALQRIGLLEEDKANLEARCQRLNEENVGLRNDGSRLHDLLQQAERQAAFEKRASADLKEKLVEVSSALAAAQREVHELQMQDDTLRRDHGKLVEVVEAQQAEIAVLTEARIRVETSHRELQERHHSLHVKNQVLAAESSKLARERDVCMAELKDLSRRHRKLSDGLLEETYKEALASTEQLRAELLDARQTIVRLKADMELYESLSTELRLRGLHGVSPKPPA